MFDSALRPLIDPALNQMGRAMAKRGLSANGVTLAGLGLGLASAAMIALGWTGWGLALLLVSRLADGLDGAVARATHKTDFGGYLDITCDFLFYGAIPLAFVILDPAANAIAGAYLLTSFYFNGATFLGYAILAEKHGLETTTRGTKSLYFTGGLLEGAETIGFFVLLCLAPSIFGPAAYVFGTLCFITATSRILLARAVFGAIPTSKEDTSV